MSSTIKQAILSLKSRIADAYTAIVEKGGTLPATQDSANLPSAIASIPSGGGTDYLYAILQGDGTTNINIYSESVTELNRGLARGYSAPVLVETLELPNCNKVDAYGFDELFNRYGIVNIKLPSCTYFNGGNTSFCLFRFTKTYELGAINSGRTNVLNLVGNQNYSTNYFAYDLEYIKLGNGWDISINIANWIADNVDALTIDNNVRDYIANTAADNSAGAAKSITMHPRLYAKLSQTTIDIFTAKNWDINLSPNFG